MKAVSSLRYCRICKKNTIFVYNRVIGHSECRGCGLRFSSTIISKLDIVTIIEERMLELKRHLDTNKSMEKKPVQARLDELKLLLKKINERWKR